jgi:hypothetical protein
MVAAMNPCLSHVQWLDLTCQTSGEDQWTNCCLHKLLIHHTSTTRMLFLLQKVSGLPYQDSCMIFSQSLWTRSTSVLLPGKEVIYTICHLRTGHLSSPYLQRQYPKHFLIPGGGGHHGTQDDSSIASRLVCLVQNC